MDITYDYYRIFYFVAKYKSFTRAASILMNSQPNITRSMNNLEKQLGCSLFIRSNRGVRLTEEGKTLYKHVAIAFEQLQTAELELLNEDTLKSGLVSVSASETALHEILLPVLRDYHNAYPGVHIRISNHSTLQAIDAVRKGLTDFAVVTTPTKIKMPMKETHLMDFREVLVCSRKYSFLSASTHHLAELVREYPYISLGRETMTYSFFTDVFYRYGLDLEPDIEVATADQMLPMITHDLGIGFVPEHMIRSQNLQEQICEIPLYEKIPLRSIALVEDGSSTRSVASAELKRMLLGRSPEKKK